MSKEIMQEAVWALKDLISAYPETSCIETRISAQKVIATLEAELTQPEQEPVTHAVIAGVLFDFMGWLTSRQERLVLSASDDASPAVKVIEDFAKMRGLSLDDAKVKNWQDMTAQPEQEHPLDKKADNARELGLDYEPDMSTNQQVPFYTAPPEREWQDLDEVEIIGCTCECIDDGIFNMKCAIDFARAIEAQLRKNNE